MLTVAEMAKEYGISVQTVYRAMDRLDKDVKQGLTQKIKGVGYFTYDGEKIIREQLAGVKHVEHNSGESSTVLNADDKADSKEEILYLREQNAALLQELEKERAYSRQQGERLADLADKLADLNRNQQVLLKQEQDRTPPMLADEREPPGYTQDQEQQPEQEAPQPSQPEKAEKAGFFTRFFGKK